MVGAQCSDASYHYESTAVHTLMLKGVSGRGAATPFEVPALVPVAAVPAGRLSAAEAPACPARDPAACGMCTHHELVTADAITSVLPADVHPSCPTTERHSSALLMHLDSRLQF